MTKPLGVWVPRPSPPPDPRNPYIRGDGPTVRCVGYLTLVGLVIGVVLLLTSLVACSDPQQSPAPIVSTTHVVTPSASTTRTSRPAVKITTETTDPRFDTCKDAKSAGYGPYSSDDPEYSWYEDRDGDGEVCE